MLLFAFSGQSQVIMLFLARSAVCPRASLVDSPCWLYHVPRCAMSQASYLLLRPVDMLATRQYTRPRQTRQTSSADHLLPPCQVYHPVGDLSACLSGRGMALGDALRWPRPPLDFQQMINEVADIPPTYYSSSVKVHQSPSDECLVDA